MNLEQKRNSVTFAIVFLVLAAIGLGASMETGNSWVFTICLIGTIAGIINTYLRAMQKTSLEELHLEASKILNRLHALYRRLADEEIDGDTFDQALGSIMEFADANIKDIEKEKTKGEDKNGI